MSRLFCREAYPNLQWRQSLRCCDNLSDKLHIIATEYSNRGYITYSRHRPQPGGYLFRHLLKEKFHKTKRRLLSSVQLKRNAFKLFFM